MVMSSPTRPSTLVRSCSGRLLGVTVALSLSLLSTLVLIEPAQAAPTKDSTRTNRMSTEESKASDSPVTASASSFTIHGQGWGHGWGMSQYGAYGAARKGLSWKQILGFYYTGTKVEKQTTLPRIRVWVTADSDADLRVLPAAGLWVSDPSGKRVTLPTGSKYDLWRLSRSGSSLKLSYRNGSGSWVTYKTSLGSGMWSFHNKATIVRVKMPNGSVRPYRGYVGLVKRKSSARTVNTVSLQSYVKGVVASEMPTSWATDAVKAQAVAARSYAVRLASFQQYDGADLCDTTSCQVYGGVNRETTAGNAAVRATKEIIVTYKGKVAYTQFASSNGGSSANGDFPYLKAKNDPYDGVITSHKWSRSISKASLKKAWPKAGTVTSLKVTARDGHGRWGGRVTKIKISGSKGSVTVAGSTFQSRFGLKSRLFSVG
jgi:stage II sporulation protein D